VTGTIGTPSENRPQHSGPFRPGDRVQLTGPRGRLNTITLEPGKVFHTHKGVLEHDSIIGLPDGSVVVNNVGIEHLALRPLLGDFVMSMPRGAAIVYPKDAAQILAQADIFPGATVVEAGVGSGALSLWLLRAIGQGGVLASFERRDEFADVARANVATFYGYDPENWSITVGDLVDELPQSAQPGTVDRVVLDMLAPWECVDVVADALKPGGVLLCYVATVTQLSRVAEAIKGTELFTQPDSSETMVRGWHVEGLAVRPDHRMIGHTGFLITARRLAPGAVLPELKRRPSKSDYSDEDVEAWTPGALGERAFSPKSLRKRVRAAATSAELAKKRDAPEEEHAGSPDVEHDDSGVESAES
jgi:tRNA (adenine57-N1/adenine58-N1)-methyltransferase